MSYLSDSDRGRRILARCDELAAITEPGDGVTRLYLTREHKRAIDLVSHWMREAGMEVHVDAAANVIGRYASQDGSYRPSLVIGSHIDSVVNAGKFDGPLGVICAVDCVAQFNREKRRFPFAIEVVAFGDEEGTRFGSTLIGSRALTGTLTRADLEHKDQAGISVGEALRQFGQDPGDIQSARRLPGEILAYLELHIEQGPVLEEAGLPAGIVTAISAQRRYFVTLSSEPNHAGTVPMNLRRDPLPAGAEIALAVERFAAALPDAVGTVGQFRVSPGAVNVIPGLVALSLDLRARSDDVLKTLETDVLDAVNAIAARRNVAVDTELLLENRATACAERMIGGLERAVTDCGHKVLKLPSGAGHDGMAIAELAPIGMIFVRCERGISHSPLEAVNPADVAAGAQIMSRFIETFSRK